MGSKTTHQVYIFASETQGITLTPKIWGAKTKAAQKSWGQISKILLPPATKLGQGYIFTGVCDSVHGGGGGAWLLGAGCAWLLGGMRGCGGEGVRGIRQDTVNERAVRILLECILVLEMCFMFNRIVVHMVQCT